MSKESILKEIYDSSFNDEVEKLSGMRVPTLKMIMKRQRYKFGTKGKKGKIIKADSGVKSL